MEDDGRMGNEAKKGLGCRAARYDGANHSKLKEGGFDLGKGDLVIG